MNASSAYSGLITKSKVLHPSRVIRYESNLLMTAGKVKQKVATDDGI